LYWVFGIFAGQIQTGKIMYYSIRHLVNKNQLVFRKWSRKGFAVFNSLHREVKIGVLCVTAFTSLGVFKTVAQNDTAVVFEKVGLDEVVVSADVVPQLQSEVGRVVTVITKDEIQAAPVASISDLLEFALNVDVRQRGSHGVQADISIRGGTFDQVLVLLNGVNISDPQTGHNILNLPIDLHAVEKIEILQGAGARHLGTNAFSGAINIITNVDKPNSLNVAVSGGDFGFYRGNMGVSFSNSVQNHYVSAGVKGSDGYIPNTDFSTQNLFYQGGLKLTSAKFDWQFGFTDNAFGANSFYTAKYPNQYEQVKTTFASVGFTTGTRFKIAPTLYYRGGNDRFELFRDNAALFPFNFHKTDVLGGKINNTYTWAGGRTSVGVEVRNESVRSTTLGNTPDTVKVPGYDVSYLKKYSRTNYSFFAQHTYRMNRFYLSAGFMAFSSSAPGYSPDIYPGADVSYELLDGLRVKASVNRTMRMPTFTDLFYNGPSNLGNPDLKPEKALSYETGLKLNKPGIASEATLYYRRGSDIIDWVRYSQTDKYVTTNYAKVNSRGAEFTTHIDPGALLGEPVFVQRISVNYAYNQLDTVAQDGDSKYALDYLRHKFAVSLVHKVAGTLFMDWHLTGQDRAGSYLSYMGKNSETGADVWQTVDFEPVWLLNARLFWQLPKSTFFVEASNLLNTTYMDIADVRQPGRWVRAGVTVNLTY
jgi:vitamin B12 transporter